MKRSPDFLLISLFCINFWFQFTESSNTKHRYSHLPEIYSYQKQERRGSVDNDGIAADIDENLSTSSDSSGSIVSSTKDASPERKRKIKGYSDLLEEYIETAVTGDSIEWKTLPESEMPIRRSSDVLTGQYTHINVPLFYEKDIETKYGLTGNYIKKSFFLIYLRKYYWDRLDYSKPIRHVILVAGGPGESGMSWITKLTTLSRQYGRENLVFYVADHRGVYNSRDMVELITKESSGGQSRTSWRRIRRSAHVSEKTWMNNVREFERQVGYPLVAMSCSNAARDLALISLVIRKHLPRSDDGRFYLHAQSYGTQVSTRTLLLLPNFYDGVLLEGLATMELVKESAKSDFGILSSCAKDRSCSQMYIKTEVPRGALTLNGPFDLRNLLEGMTQKPHNRQCRDVFLKMMQAYVYSETISFWDAVYLSFYELLSDDFLNSYTGTKGNFYPGMLVLPIIKDMYYCEDLGRFRRQMTKMIEVIAISVRGLNQPYLKTPSKSKPSDSKEIRSEFVQTYINAHEAFDMKGMSRSIERRYCERPNHPDLINQCSIWKEQVRKMRILESMTGTPDLLPKDPESKPVVMSGAPLKQNAKDAKKKDKIAIFEGRYGEEELDTEVENDGGKRESRRSNSSSSSSSCSSSSSSSSSSVESTDGHGTNEISHTIKLFTIYDKSSKKNKSKHRSSKSKKSRKSKKSKKSRKSRKSKKKSFSFGDLFKMAKSPKTAFEDVEISKHFKDKKKGGGQGSGDTTGQTTGQAIGKTTVKNTGQKRTNVARKYYYNVEDDELAYGIPASEKTRIFVTMGSLDVKTPLLEARRLLSRIEAPFKVLFELSNIAHATEPCRGQIVRAMTAEGLEAQGASLSVAMNCVQQLEEQRKLDWQFEEVRNIPKADWIV